MKREREGKAWRRTEQAKKRIGRSGKGKGEMIDALSSFPSHSIHFSFSFHPSDP